MRALVLLVILGCGHDAVVPSDSSSTPTAIIATCGDISVTAHAYAPGVVRLRYAAVNAPVKPSWVVAAIPVEPVAGRLLETAEMRVEIDGQCRVRATLADGTIAIADAEPFSPTVLSRTPNTNVVYGLGERTGGLNKRGRAWTFWNTDAYDPSLGGWKPGQDPLYQSIPFELHQVGARTFGIFTDETRRMTIDLEGSRDRVIVDGARSIEQYVIAGPRMADVVDRYTQLTGRPALPPRWALGFHQSRWGYNSGAQVEAIATKYRELGIPADAIWLDIQHMRGFRSFTFDPQTFSDPQGLVARLSAQGFRVITIQDPGIKVDPGWDVYDSGQPHFLDYVGKAWPGDSKWPDFSSEGARAWWGQQIGKTLDVGVAGIWLDVNEPTTFPEGGGGTTIPDEVAGAGGTMAELHNVYALLQSRATYEAIAARGKRPFVLTRAGYAGIQRYAAVWTGDTPSTWQGLQQTLPMLLGLGLSGVPIVGSDVGGYSGHASTELYARWFALGAISPFARAHVTNNVPGQEPWMFGAEVLRASRSQLDDRYRLLPYLYSLADEAARTGAPLLRPMVWEFPEDPTVTEMGDQAMLGPSILVAPVVEKGATSRQVYLPAGRWYDYASDAIYDGPTTIRLPVRLASMPMFVREGAIIPTADGVDVYPGTGRFTLYEDDGETGAGATRTNIAVTARADGIDIVADKALTFNVHRVERGNSRMETVSGATISLTFERAMEPAPMVEVPIEVHVPNGPVYIAASTTNWTHVQLTVTGNVARGVLTARRGEWIDYKITRGSWETVEKLADCSEAPNRTRIASHKLVVDRVEAWRGSCN